MKKNVQLARGHDVQQTLMFKYLGKGLHVLGCYFDQLSIR